MFFLTYNVFLSPPLQGKTEKHPTPPTTPLHGRRYKNTKSHSDLAVTIPHAAQRDTTEPRVALAAIIHYGGMCTAFYARHDAFLCTQLDMRTIV